MSAFEKWMDTRWPTWRDWRDFNSQESVTFEEDAFNAGLTRAAEICSDIPGPVAAQCARAIETERDWKGERG